MPSYRQRLGEDTDLCSSILCRSSTVNGRFGSGTGMGSLVPWRRARAVSSGIVPGIVEVVCPMIIEGKYSWGCDVEMWVCTRSSDAADIATFLGKIWRLQKVLFHCVHTWIRDIFNRLLALPHFTPSSSPEAVVLSFPMQPALHLVYVWSEYPPLSTSNNFLFFIFFYQTLDLIDLYRTLYIPSLGKKKIWNFYLLIMNLQQI